MNCLQCGKSANETGDVMGNIKIRECVDGHRTGQASKAMITASKKWKGVTKKAQSEGLIDYSANDEKAA